jgi:hypothetical protein
MQKLTFQVESLNELAHRVTISWSRRVFLIKFGFVRLLMGKDLVCMVVR